jgi:hypothetical protein
MIRYIAFFGALTAIVAGVSATWGFGPALIATGLTTVFAVVVDLDG